VTTYKNQIAEDIKRVRTALGLTQEGLAEAFNAIDDGLKTSRLDILKYERGINTPPSDKYIKIMNMGRS
jgi:transcriptional regulator with XRE-family HTH domain